MAHSVGPWEVSAAIDETGAHVFAPDPKGATQDHDVLTVADLILNPSDAALIAAAPTLLAAGKRLKAAMGRLVMANVNGQSIQPLEAEINEAQDAMIAAIAKAEGR